MIEVDYSSPKFGTLRAASPHAVYTRARWYDPWRYARGLYATEATWALSPDIGTAQLHWKYGVGMLRGERGFSVRTPDTGEVRYVKIEIAATDGNDVIPWIGMISGGAADAGGRGTSTPDGQSVVPSGSQTLSCLSLEKLLEDTAIRSAVWLDSEAGETFVSDRPLIFNAPRADGKPCGNRSSHPMNGSFVFSGRVGGEDQLWTTHHIVEYLLAHHWPRDFRDAPRLPVILDNQTRLTLMLLRDKPVVDPTHRTLREVLNQLLPPHRLLSWHLYVRDDALYFRVVPLTGDPIVFPDDGGVLLGCDRQVAINYELSRDVRPVHVLAHQESVDRIRLRGRPATVMFSLQWSEDNPGIDRGWTDEQEEKYETGASEQTGYDALDDEQKNQRNAEFRNRDELLGVYSRFAIPNDWNGETDQGRVFLNVYATDRYKICPRELFLLPTLPLLDGFKYETEVGAGGVKIKKTERAPGPHNELAPLVVFKDPEKLDDDDPDHYVQVETIGMQPAGSWGVPRGWSSHVMIPERDRAIVLQIDNAPQHVIAGLDDDPGGDGFSPLPVEAEANEALWHWRDALFTVAAEMGCHCEGVYPPELNVPGRDTIRELTIDAGDAYRLDRIHAGTVIGVQDDGSLERITEGVYLNDDRKKLAVRAEMAFAWFGVPRTSVRFSAPDLRTDIQLGDFVRTVVASGQPQTVNCTVTRISLSIPVDGGSLPTISYDTQFSQLDIGGLL